MTHIPFILASSSPRRLMLLKDIGITPDKVVSPDIDETPHKAEKPRDLAYRLSYEKLQAVRAQYPGAFLLTADTVVGVGRRILPKAENDAQVRDCLVLMSGRRHHVYTGVAIQNPQGKTFRRVSDSTSIFRKLTLSDIDTYVSCGEGVGKAGGYSLMGRAQTLVRFISGSYSGIIGLPLFEVGQMLQSAGWRPL
jgi:septum formation protein